MSHNPSTIESCSPRRLWAIVIPLLLAVGLAWWQFGRESGWRLQSTLQTDLKGVGQLALSPDSSQLALQGGITTALWDVTKRLPIKTFETEWMAEDVAFSPNGSLLAIAGWHGVEVWDLLTMQIRRKFTIPKETTSVNCLAFSPDGTTLAGGDSDGILHLWDIDTGRKQSVFQEPGAAFYCLAFSLDGQILVVGGAWRFLHVWPVGKKEYPTNLSYEELGDVWSLAFSPDGKTLAVADRDAGIALLDVSTWSTTAKIPVPGGATFATYSPDGKRLIVGSRLASTSWGKKVPFADNLSNRLGVDTRPYELLLVFNASTQAQMATIAAHRQATNAAVFTGDGQTLITAGDDTMVRFWEVPR